jgi:hypothetical protein
MTLSAKQLRDGPLGTLEPILSGFSRVRYIATTPLLFAMFSGAVGVPQPQQAVLAASGTVPSILLRSPGWCGRPPHRRGATTARHPRPFPPRFWRARYRGKA